MPLCIGYAGRMRNSLLFAVLMLICSSSAATEVNDLWLLLSSYEDIGITVKDLAFFLATHGYDAFPEKSYVTVELSDGSEVYLTPNGGAERLADLWMTPPAEKTGPVKIISSDAVEVDAECNKTENADFIKTATRYVIFPVTPLGMCYDGSQKLENIYKSFGINAKYMYDPSGFDSQGHLWVVLEDDHSDEWLAVDSYYGVMADDEYYQAPYAFADFKYLDSVNPKWNAA
jgi:hypothetical protein